MQAASGIGLTAPDRGADGNRPGAVAPSGCQENARGSQQAVCVRFGRWRLIGHAQAGTGRTWQRPATGGRQEGAALRAGRCAVSLELALLRRMQVIAKRRVTVRSMMGMARLGLHLP